ncbi:Methyltransferase domain-containing protein [Cladophialophora immunda]|nr:Methyltransferase domain-containing protein [Cladophialophora immunda]
MAEQEELPLTVDESDSALGEDVYSDDETVTSSVFRYPEENGRRYHAYKDGAYLFPNDEPEQDRLDLQHQISLHVGNGELYHAPVENPGEILDIGTGTGIWAIDVADRYPSARVLGIDLSPIQPGRVPPNCHFQISDFEDGWVFERRFDLIHGRLLIGSVSKPRQLIRNAYEYLAPGGWLEFQDACPPRSDDNTIPPDSAYRQWVDAWCDALQRGGRDPLLATKYGDLLREVGFINVNIMEYKVPQNCWAKGPYYKRLGLWNAVNILKGIEGLSMRPFTRDLGWSTEEVQVLLAQARPDIKDPNIHAYWPVYVVYGQKPYADRTPPPIET